MQVWKIKHKIKVVQKMPHGRCNKSWNCSPNDEIVPNATRTSNTSLLSPEASTAQQVLLQTIKTLYCVCNDASEDLHETPGLLVGVNLSKSVDLLLCNYPYAVRRQQDL